MIFMIAAVTFLIDRITKSIAVNNLFLGQSSKVIPGIFHLTLVLNRGTAFGLFKGWTAFFILLSVVVIAGIVIYVFRNKGMDILLSWALGLILGGALGNLFDRLRFGCVIDFFDFRIWPIFNVADSCLTIGVLILIFKIFTERKKKEA